MVAAVEAELKLKRLPGGGLSATLDRLEQQVGITAPVAAPVAAPCGNAPVAAPGWI